MGKIKISRELDLNVCRHFVFSKDRSLQGDFREEREVSINLDTVEGWQDRVRSDCVLFLLLLFLSGGEGRSCSVNYRRLQLFHAVVL